ncbi:response regulator [Fictibacillus fluitans]|uniref:Response regulator n=1 Tax=Fictibacillus fluitans TaxID=3058422 RepID=A0ABT8HQE9_9BACL|nr:response regulator [Fictibacillus sp. NE201]MDN4522969.1 response regulator [Fictibacillus sp. NE201]
MLKAAIFDDEPIVLQGLQAMINWESYGIELIGTATDGLSAIHLFEEHHPDIIFTDIRMPKYNGLTLIEKILSISPETICIVFSGFNEYEYVKQAIKLGVVDYLEKPITIPMIKDVLEKIIDLVQKKRTVSELKLLCEKNRSELLEKATLDLLNWGARAVKKWRKCFGDGAVNIKHITVLALTERIEQLKKKGYEIIHIQNGPQHLAVVLHYDSDVNDHLSQLMNEIKNSDVSGGAGRTYSSLDHAPQSYLEAKKAIRYAKFLGQHGLTSVEEISVIPLGTEQLTDQEKAIINCLRTGDIEGSLTSLDQLVNQLQLNKQCPEIIEQEMLKILYLAIEAVKGTGKNFTQIYHSDFLPHVEIRELNGCKEMFHWFRLKFEVITEWMEHAKRNDKHEAVEKACAYIKENFHRDLCLQEVAEFVGMNATYFSLLFKEKMGLSYIKYLTHFRMEHAKDLLQEGNKVTDVSKKVGYHSYRHFSELFKKHSGINPGLYKNSI